MEYHIIASDYVDLDKLPSTKNGYSPKLRDSNHPKAAKFWSVVSDYNGSSDITDGKIKKLNNDYFSKGYTSTNVNMKAVAYMLDTNIWNSFKADKADYAIGGPTIEMLISSYNKKHNVDYRVRATGTYGYYTISIDGGKTWKSEYPGMLDKNDSLYALSSSETGGMWLASPSYDERVMCTDSNSRLYYWHELQL